MRKEAVDRENRFIVCRHCLMAIESHEGNQIHIKIDNLELTDLCDDNEIIKCGFCEDEFCINDIDAMYEIF